LPDTTPVTGTLVPRPSSRRERLSPWRWRRHPGVQFLALWVVLFVTGFAVARHAVPWTQVAAGAAFIATVLVAAHHSDQQRRAARTRHHDHGY
jgi:hypothetical protein